MQPIKIKLAERVNLNVIETDKFKTNFISIDFLSPLKKETAAYNALLPQVLRRGTAKHRNMTRLNTALDTLYASQISPFVSKYGEVQSFGFYSYPLDNVYALEETDILGGPLDILKDVIFDPYTENGLLSEAFVESEKRTLTDRIKAQINNKNSYAVSRCRDVMCEGEAYAIPETGTVEDVEKITAKSLTEHYKAVLKTADVEIYYVGRNYGDLVIEKFRNMFASLERNGSEPLKTKVIRHAENVKEYTEEQPVSQGKLSLGFRTDSILGEDDFRKFILMREILGGTTSSKLFMNVREKLSLCYYCSAIPESYKGIMIITSGIDVSNKEKVQKEILAQIEECKKGNITDDELDAAKKALANAYLELGDDAGAIKRWFFTRNLANMTDTPESWSEAIMKTTAEEAAEAAKRITLDTVYFLKGTLTDSKEEAEEDDE